MSFNPLISLARNAKRQRMEMQCDPQWVLDLAAERDQLRAELIKANDRYQRDVYGLNNEGDPIGGEPPGGYANDNARLRAEVAMLRSYEAEWERSLNQLRAELEAIRGQQTDTWPKLDKPAKVGPVRFNPGLSARLVVEAAKRQHEYSQQPEVEAARLKRFQSAMREFHGEQPDAVSVPRELLRRLLDSNSDKVFCATTYRKAQEELSALLSTKNAGDE